MSYPVLKKCDYTVTSKGSFTLTSHWFQGDRASITSIEFVDYYENVNAVKGIPCDENDNGDITYYVVDGKLIIAGNGSGGIYANPDSSLIFRAFTNMTSFDSGVLDTSRVTSLAYAFYDCYSLEYLDLTSWNVKNVTSLFNTFNSAAALKTLLVNNWDTSNNTNCNNTFMSCKSLEILDLSSWNFSNVTTMHSMFAGVSGTGVYYKGYMKLKKIIGIENADVRKVTDMENLFVTNDAIEYLDLSRWYNSACVKTKNFIRNAPNLKVIVVGEGFKFNNDGQYIDAPRADYIKDADGHWYDISAKQCGTTTIPSGISATYYASVPLVENLDVIVKNKTLIDTAQAIRVKNENTKQITPSTFGDEIKFVYPTISASFLFAINKSTTVEEIKFVTEPPQITESDILYNKVLSWPADDLHAGTIMAYMKDHIVYVCPNGYDKIRVAQNASGLFADLPWLRNIDGLDLLDMSHVRIFDRAFAHSCGLTSIDLNGFGVGFSEKLVSYKGLFECAHRLKTISLWDGIASVSPRMFRSCVDLETINGLSNVVEIGEGAFVNCVNLTHVDIDASKILIVGNDAARRSNLEDVVDFTTLPSEATVGVRALRTTRWDETELSAIKNFFVENSYDNVYIEVPNAEIQYDYPHYIIGYDGEYNNVPCYIASWGCGFVTTYHEWNAVYNMLAKQNPDYYTKVYPSFATWFEKEVLEKDPEHTNNDMSGFNPSAHKSVPATTRSVLGWTSGELEFVESVTQLESIAERLQSGKPLFASVYTTSTTLSGSHAVLIVGMNPSEGKIAIVDSSVVGHTGVVMWLRFEDLFVRKGWSGDPDEPDRIYGQDRLQPVIDYNLPSVSE